MRRFLGLLLAAALRLGAGPAGDLAATIRQNSLDRDQCYRVRDLNLFKEDIRIYLTDGYLIFSKPIDGQPVAAFFTTYGIENGTAEVILRPPNLAERRSLAAYTGSPNLDEHFQSALFFLSGDMYQALVEQLPANPANRKMPEMGALLEERYNPVLRNLSADYELRLVLELFNRSARKPEFFTALVEGSSLGNFDVFFDPDNSDQIAAGQFVVRNNRSFFDVWTHFPARSARGGIARRPMGLVLNDYRIQATVDPDLKLSVVARVKFRSPLGGLRAVPFDIAREMVVADVTVDGQPAEVLQRDAVERSRIGRGENAMFLVMPPAPLQAGVEYEFEFHYAGRTIADAGGRVFYVAARGNWYPNLGAQLARFDLTFRYPSDLELVAAGEVVEDRTEGEWRITRRLPSAPIRMAGFNLGEYTHAKSERAGFTVDICANRSIEPALRPKPAAPPPLPVIPAVPRRQGRLPSQIEIPPPVVQPEPAPHARLDRLANNIGGMLAFMASKFGPPALPYLTVSPIPGNFGQGYPGLIYLSTRSYLPPAGSATPSAQDVFFDELLELHETAHQWWGALVSTPSYRDDWLMEALANYSALLYLERTQGERELERFLDVYRADLLKKRDTGEPVESAGPIVMGSRLESSLEPRAWEAITYGKGSWILQMLRHRMGDERFFSMLAGLLKRYGGKDISTEEFRLLAAEYLPPKSDDPKLEGFFDQWVYGTGMPSLKLSYTVKGKAAPWKLVGTLAQADVPEDFSALTPVEIQLPQGRAITRWVHSSGERETFTVDLPQPPLKVLLDPHYAVLRR